MRHARTWLLVAAALVFVAFRAPFVSVPFERDEGEYAYIAWRMTEGDVPYRDAFDQKPPGVFVAYLAAFALLGESTEAIRIFHSVWIAAAAWLLFLLVRRLAGELAGAGAVLLFAASAVDPAMGANAANTEAFMLVPLVGAVLCLERGLADDRARWWLACGALAAGACWFKQVAASNALFVVLFAALELPGSGAAARAAAWLRRAGWLAVGAAAVSLPVFAAFALADASGPFLDAVFLHNLAYAQRRTLSEGLDNLRFELARQAGSLALLWGLAAVALLRPGIAGARTWRWLSGWLAFSLLGVASGLQFRPHYFLQAVPALAALGGVTLGAGVRAVLARPDPRLAWAGVGALLLLVVAPPLAAHRATLLAGSPEAVSRRVYGLNPFPESVEIARHIEHTSEPDDAVFVVGSEPQILFYAGRRSASRYIFFYPLTGGYEDGLERQQEAFAEVRAAEPRYVVWVNVPTSLLASEKTEPWVFEETDAMLRREYRLEFVLRPDERLEGYETIHGRDAVRWLRAGRDRFGELPWIEVHRRRG